MKTPFPRMTYDEAMRIRHRQARPAASGDGGLTRGYAAEIKGL